jgi:hypothetical protein
VFEDCRYEHSGSITAGEFLDGLNNYNLLKEDFVLCS